MHSMLECRLHLDLCRMCELVRPNVRLAEQNDYIEKLGNHNNRTQRFKRARNKLTYIAKHTP